MIQILLFQNSEKSYKLIEYITSLLYNLFILILLWLCLFENRFCNQLKKNRTHICNQTLILNM